MYVYFSIRFCRFCSTHWAVAAGRLGFKVKVFVGWSQAGREEGESKYSDISVKGWKVGFPSWSPSTNQKQDSQSTNQKPQSLERLRGCEAQNLSDIIQLNPRIIIMNCLLPICVLCFLSGQSPCSTTNGILTENHDACFEVKD